MIEAAQERAAALLRRRDRGARALPRVARSTATSSSSATASTRSRTAGSASSRTRASASCATTRAPVIATPVPVDDDRARAARAAARRRPARRLEDEPLLDRAPPREDGRHHDQARRARTARPSALLRLLGLFTSQGLHGARRAGSRSSAASFARSPPPRTSSRARTTTRRWSSSSSPSPRTSSSRRAPRSCAQTLVSAARPAGAANIQLFVRPDLDEGRVAVLVALPRDRFNAELRQRLQESVPAALRRLVGRLPPLARGVRPGAHPLHRARRRRVSRTSRSPSSSRRSSRSRRTWDDRLREQLVALHGEERGGALAAKYATLLPDYYKSSTDVYLAVLDIEQFERLDAGEPFVVGLQNERDSGPEPDARRPLQDGRQGAALRLPADPRGTSA